MNKLLSLILIFGVFIVSGCGKNIDNITDQHTLVKGDVEDNICQQFDANFTYSVLNKPIAHMNASPIGDITFCQYYTEYNDDFYKMPDGSIQPGGPWLSMKLDNLSVDDQKKAADFLEWTIKTDSRIKMEHFLGIQKDGNINTVYLIINPNRFISMGRSSRDVIGNEEIINWAAKVAEKIQGTLLIEIKTNPLGNEVKPWGKLSI